MLLSKFQDSYKKYTMEDEVQLWTVSIVKSDFHVYFKVVCSY